jgi:Lrp/AsnC family transcriptional regulator for asnA, asnC and gidA
MDAWRTQKSYGKISNLLVHQRIKKLQDTGIISGFSIQLRQRNYYETITYNGVATKEARFAYSIAEHLKEIPRLWNVILFRYVLF